MPADFFVFAFVGFLAQLVDGALGMAYGVISSTALLSFGVTPAAASASVHAAELFTTAVSGGSHAVFRNIDWRVLRTLAPAGVLGGALGAYLLTSVDGAIIRPFVIGYLGIMGALIIYRGIRPARARALPLVAIGPLGAVGGFLDATGGGGWGPVVTSTIIGSGGNARFTIGTVNAAEFFVTAGVSAAFFVALASGHWREATGLADHASAVAGLIAGGLVAAPLAGFIAKRAPTRPLTILVGALVIALATYQLLQILKVI